MDRILLFFLFFIRSRESLVSPRAVNGEKGRSFFHTGLATAFSFFFLSHLCVVCVCVCVIDRGGVGVEECRGFIEFARGNVFCGDGWCGPARKCGSPLFFLFFFFIPLKLFSYIFSFTFFFFHFSYFCCASTHTHTLQACFHVNCCGRAKMAFPVIII